MDTVPKIHMAYNSKVNLQRATKMRFQMDCNDNLAYEDFLQNFVYSKEMLKS